MRTFRYDLRMFGGKRALKRRRGLLASTPPPPPPRKKKKKGEQIPPPPPPPSPPPAGSERPAALVKKKSTYGCLSELLSCFSAKSQRCLLSFSPGAPVVSRPNALRTRWIGFQMPEPSSSRASRNRFQCDLAQYYRSDTPERFEVRDSNTLQLASLTPADVCGKRRFFAPGPRRQEQTRELGRSSWRRQQLPAFANKRVIRTGDTLLLPADRCSCPSAKHDCAAPLSRLAQNQYVASHRGHSGRSFMQQAKFAAHFGWRPVCKGAAGRPIVNKSFVKEVTTNAGASVQRQFEPAEAFRRPGLGGRRLFCVPLCECALKCVLVRPRALLASGRVASSSQP